MVQMFGLFKVIMSSLHRLNVVGCEIMASIHLDFKSWCIILPNIKLYKSTEVNLHSCGAMNDCDIRCQKQCYNVYWSVVCFK